MSPPRVSSAGKEVVELVETTGLKLDPWQKLVLEEAFGEKRGGNWASFEVGLVLSRQSGKGVILESAELASLFLFDEELCIHSAHLFDTSLEHFNRVLSLIESSPEMDRMVQRVSRSHGDEGIEVKRDGVLRRLRFRTRTKGGGRGFTADRVVFDEAMILGDKAVGAILPTLNAVPNPQVWYTATAGDWESTQLGRVRSRALMGGDPKLTYLEWSAEGHTEFCIPNCHEHDQTWFRDNDPAPTPDDRRERIIVSYQKANPGLGNRISIDTLEANRRSMSEDQFNREILGITEWPVDGAAWRVIDEASWMSCTDETSAAEMPFAIGIDMTPDRIWTSIAVAGFTTNREGERCIHVEITSKHRADGWLQMDHRRGEDWQIPRIQELVKNLSPCAVVIDKGQQAGSFVSKLEDEKIEILSPSQREYAQACGEFGSKVVVPTGHKRTLVHINQHDLTSAVSGVTKRESADMWAWSKRGASVDISPLVAATLAVWGLQKNGSKPKAQLWGFWGD